MRESQGVTHTVAVVVAGAASLAYAARAFALPGDGAGGAAVMLGLTFVALAGVGVLRAVRSGRRPADVLLAFGLVSSALGWLYWSVRLVPMATPPYPSLADGLWMVLYPLAFASLAWQVGRGAAARRALVLDLLIGTAGVTAAIAGLVVPRLAGDAKDLTVVGVNSVYLGANVAHVLLLVGVIATRRFRVPAALWRRLLGAAVLAVTNAMWLGDVVGTGVVPVGSVLNLGWLGGFALLVSSVGAPEPDERSAVRWPGAAVVAPLSGTVLALAVLLDTPARFAGTRWIAVAATVLALARMTQAVADASALAGSYRLSRTDELTGLVNRRGVYDVLRATLAAEETATLVLADLNRFKEVNDTLGHQAGDALLVLVGERLAAETRIGGRGPDVVARFGGDEFVLVLHRASPREGEAAARRLLAALDGSYDVGGLAVRSSAAAGLVHLPESGVDADELLRQADVAMYAAKAAGEPLVVYRPELDTRSVADLARTERVRAWLSGGQLVLHYQPKVDLRTGEVRGVEALARLRDEDGGLLMPARVPAGAGRWCGADGAHGPGPRPGRLAGRRLAPGGHRPVGRGQRAGGGAGGQLRRPRARRAGALRAAGQVLVRRGDRGVAAPGPGRRACGARRGPRARGAGVRRRLRHRVVVVDLPARAAARRAQARPLVHQRDGR